MAKITIDDILAAFASTTAINARFDQVEDELNNKVLYRDNPVGEPNSMSNDLDMNGNDILNVNTLNAEALSLNGTSIILGGEYTASEVADVSNIAALRLLTGDTALHVSLRGYYAEGDGGGGLFYWGATSPATDNGGTVIKPTAVSGNGRWLRIYDQAINVKWFGAGNGTDAVPLQSAMDSLPNGGTIYFPAGEYSVATQLTYNVSGSSGGKPGIRFIGEGRRSTKITYSGTSGYLFHVTGTAIDNAGNGLIEGVQFKHMHLVGTGKSSGNTDSAIYIQAFQFCIIQDCMIEEFGQDGVRADRLYYQTAPDPTLDDRGLGLKLSMVQVRACGRHGVWCGGGNANDYSIDHLLTELLYISQCGDTGLKVNVNNWVDINSLLQSDLIGCHLYGIDPIFVNSSVVLNGTRFELLPSDCNLKIDQVQNFKAIGASFIANSTPLPATGIKIGTDALYNVQSVVFSECKWFQHTNAIDIIGAGGVANVKVENPFYSSVTNKLVNTGAKPCQLIEGNTYSRQTSGGEPIALEGAAGKVLSSTLDGDAATWFELDNNTKTITLGSGTGVNNVTLKKLGTGVAIFSGGLGVGNTAANVNTPSGATARSMQVYSETGASLGYIPIYPTNW